MLNLASGFRSTVPAAVFFLIISGQRAEAQCGAADCDGSSQPVTPVKAGEKPVPRAEQGNSERLGTERELRAYRGPDWNSPYKVWTAHEVNVNGFPAESEFGANSFDIPQALAGLIRIPATDRSGNHGSGLAGYAMTSSPTKGAVGVFGAGLIDATRGQSWGINTVTTNTLLTNPRADTGHDMATMYGYEADFNIMKYKGRAPEYSLMGIYLTGASETAPRGGEAAVLDAINVDSYGRYQSPVLAWNNALYIRDGAATNAVNIGTTGTGNGVGSQPIHFRSRNDAGAGRVGTIQTDSDGNIIVAAAPEAIVVAQSGASEVYKASGRSFEIPGAIKLGQMTFASLPECNKGAEGAIAYVTDAATPVHQWHQKITSGGGNNRTFVGCNGSEWHAF